MRDLSDDQLLTLAQDGEEDAFAELMRRNLSYSFKLALSILKDRQDAPAHGHARRNHPA